MTYKEALYFLTHNGTTFDQELESHKMMVVAMHKQIPNKPTYNSNECVCGVCGNVFYEIVEDCYYKYCPICGQAIDWSDE